MPGSQVSLPPRDPKCFSVCSFHLSFDWVEASSLPGVILLGGSRAGWWWSQRGPGLRTVMGAGWETPTLPYRTATGANTCEASSPLGWEIL